MFKGFFTQFQGPGNKLVSSTVLNRALGCDPLLGLGRLEWVTAGDITGYTIELSADTGSGMNILVSGVDPTLGVLNFDVSGEAGFTSLDATNFMVELTDGIISDPLQFHSPTYACYP